MSRLYSSQSNTLEMFKVQETGEKDEDGEVISRIETHASRERVDWRRTFILEAEEVVSSISLFSWVFLDSESAVQ